MLFLLLASFGMAIAGATAYFMSWPIVVAQVRDRHPTLLPEIAGGVFAPASFLWLLRARYRRVGDAAMNFLGLPACAGAWAITLGTLGAVVFGFILFAGQRT